MDASHPQVGETFQDKLSSLESTDESYANGGGRSSSNDKIRIFMEGAFDMMHFGHMNAFRLGRSLGTYLIVGINSDDSITACKAPPLMNHTDRMAMVQACQFVDEIIPNTPYIMNKEYIDWILETYDIDYIVHGEDPCIVDGKDVYETAKEAGKFRTIPRTEGVSTTDIVGRILQLTAREEEHGETNCSNGGKKTSFLGSQSKFLTTSRLLRDFTSHRVAPRPEQRVVYIDGAWDMFHPGHVALLEEVRKQGDYVIVGIHSDATVNQVRGGRFPLFNLQERTLSVLGCRLVDDILIEVPLDISPDMIQTLSIQQVIHGTNFEDLEYGSEDDDRYEHAKAAGLFKVVKSLTRYSLQAVFQRIRTDQEAFHSRFQKKMKAEAEHYTQKYAATAAALDNGAE